jgi:hypothetical protein
MGFISILGVAVQDALLVVTYARQLRQHGHDAKAAARLAAETRLQAHRRHRRETSVTDDHLARHRDRETRETGPEKA